MSAKTPEILVGATSDVLEAYHNLNLQQAKFLLHYVKTNNGRQSAMEAGYKKSGAATQATRLLNNDNVKTVLEWLKARKTEEIGVSIERVLRAISETTFHNIQDFFQSDPQGNLFLRDIDSLDRDVAGAVKKIKITNVRRGNTDDPIDEQKIEFELYDKQKGAELLGRHLKMFSDEAASPDKSPSKDELQDALNALKEYGIDMKVVRDVTQKVH